MIYCSDTGGTTSHISTAIYASVAACDVVPLSHCRQRTTVNALNELHCFHEDGDRIHLTAVAIAMFLWQMRPTLITLRAKLRCSVL